MKGLSPGLVLGCFELLEMVQRRNLSFASISSEFSKIGVMSSAKVLDVAQTLNWIRAREDGVAIITTDGLKLLSLTSYERRVRQALLDYIDALRPAWLQNATFGRSKVISFAGSDIAQVFVEAGLAHGTDKEVVEFWDEVAARARGLKGIRLNTIGRLGERLTIEYETKRTGKKPKWIAIDSNTDGYDVLSIMGPLDARFLSIEVKSSTIGLKGSFHVTANEWESSMASDLHLFHLWDVSSNPPSLAVLSIEDVAPHIPVDRGEGQWETVEIPFEVFSSMFVSNQDV